MVGSSLVDTRSVFSETAKMENFNFSFLPLSGFRGEALTQSLDFSNGKVRPSGIVFRVVSEKRVSVHYFTAIQK